MTPAEALESASEALFGFWSPKMLGNELGVSDRTVRRWRAIDDMPRGIWADLRDMLTEKSGLMAGLAEEMLPPES